MILSPQRLDEAHTASCCPDLRETQDWLRALASPRKNYLHLVPQPTEQCAKSQRFRPGATNLPTLPQADDPAQGARFAGGCGGCRQGTLPHQPSRAAVLVSASQGSFGTIAGQGNKCTACACERERAVGNLVLLGSRIQPKSLTSFVPRCK